MNKSVFIVCAVLSIAIVFIFAENAPAQKKRKTASKKIAALTVSEQAEEQSRAFWMSRLTKCGDDYYTRDGIYIHQFKNSNIAITENSVSGADRLNGIQYLATTVLTVSQSRTYSHKSTSYQGAGWSRWSEGFTAAMGGIGLSAALKRVKGRWFVIPSSISQAGVLQPIACSDALSPAAFYRRLEEESFSADVRKFRDNAVSMGIYAHNIPAEMWTGLYNCGGLNGARYTTVSWVYLAPNGGWGAAGRNGYQSSNLLSDEDWKLVNGRWIEQVTADGGWIFLEKGDYTKRGYESKGIPELLQTQLNKFYNQKLYIKKVRIGYNGEWFVLAGDASGRETWSWYNVSDSADKAFNEIYNLYQKSMASGIRDVAFLPNGGYVIVYGRNEYYSENVPDEVSEILKTLHDGNYEISQITFGPEDSWIIRANGSW